MDLNAAEDCCELEADLLPADTPRLCTCPHDASQHSLEGRRNCECRVRWDSDGGELGDEELGVREEQAELEAAS